jgi:hypothetical protein
MISVGCRVGFDEDLMTDPHATVDDLTSAYRPYMTRACLRWLEAAAPRAIKMQTADPKTAEKMPERNHDAYRLITGLMLFGTKTAEPDRQGRILTEFRAVPVDVKDTTVGDKAAIDLHVTMTGSVSRRNPLDGKVVTGALERDVTFTLVPNPHATDPSWLISGWQAHRTQSIN